MIEYKNDKQIQENIEYILKIALRGDIIDENIEPELIIFMVKLFIVDKCRNIALSVLTPMINSNTTINECFKEAMKKSIAQKFTIPDKICMFLECKQFYELFSIHQYFIDLIIIKDENDIKSWNPDQIQKIQNLSMKYSTKTNKTGIKLWSAVFDKLIKPPQEKSIITDALALFGGFMGKTEEKKDENEMFDSEEQIEIPGAAPLKIMKSDDMEINPNDFNPEEINPFFITKLEYCIAMADWIKFSTKMKQITACYNLVQYVQSHLYKLNGYISASSKYINIKCLQLFKTKQYQIIRLSKDCQYGKNFDDKKLDLMINELNRLSNLKIYFICFLQRFTIQDEDFITGQTMNFVHFIKNWDFKQYSQVQARREWNQWLQPNAAKLIFLYEIQQSNVFFNIWCAERRQLVNTVWNFRNYLNILYPQSRHKWDDLVDRASRSSLTFNDNAWFKDLDLGQELNIMKIPEYKIRDTQRDIAHSLQIDAFVDFVEKLTKMVDIFIFNGNTKIKNKSDKLWIKLEDNLKISKQKKNDKTQSIADIAKLYRDIKGLIGVEYTNLHKQWIQTIVICKQTIHKMANDDHFKRESLQATLELLDDSNDGEMTQLSGSLRSVHTLFLRIWSKQHNSKTDLMRFIATMELKPNDVNNLRQVHDALPRIDNIVDEVGKNAEARDIKKLDDAMSHGFFKFDPQNIIQREINQSNEIEVAEIGKKCLYLDKYNVCTFFFCVCLV